MNTVPDCEILSFDGYDVAVIRLKDEMEVLSSAVLNGGEGLTRCLFIMEVPKNYMCGNPAGHAESVRKGLGLPPDAVGFMTAAEVRYVFNTKLTEFSGTSAFAAVTAGLSNQVVAGELLEDWERRSKLSSERSKALHAGTINVIGVSSVPMTEAAKVNIMIAMTEAKTAALSSLGYRETGTTSDAIAIVSPIGGAREEYAGTGTSIGIAMARSVRECVRTALIRRGDDSHGTYVDMLAEEGLGLGDIIHNISMELELDDEGKERLSDTMESLKSNVRFSLLIQCAITAEDLGKKGLLFGVEGSDYPTNTEVERVARFLSEKIAETVSGQIDINLLRQSDRCNLRTMTGVGPFLREALAGLATGFAVSIATQLSREEAPK
ncbi:MAG: adenosylcobinamide amidohydrolase [Candidatus Methanomethylophilaceae archaeon]